MCGALAILLAATVAAGAAETEAIRIGQQFGFFYLPLIVMKEQRLLEREAVRLHLPEPVVSYTRLASGAPLNDALLAGALDLAAAGVSPVITMWARTKRNLKVRAVAALGDVPFFLVTNRSDVRTLRDLRPSDRIALPAVGVSMQAVVLQMAAAVAFGPGEWKRLDAQTVSLSHPDAMAALLSRHSEITAHFANPPFQDEELMRPGISRVLSSYDVLGGPHTSALLYSGERFHDANPLTMQALLSALRAADAFIAAEPVEAARMYLRAEPSPMTVEEMSTLLRDPAIRFTVVPERLMEFARFQGQIGQIPEVPSDWREIVFPELRGEHGG